MELFLFLILAAICLVSALNVLIQRHPIYSALSLIVTFLGLAGIYLQMQAEFIAAMQVVVYTGAIMVLFIFVIMLLNARPEKYSKSRTLFIKYSAIPLSILFGIGILGLLIHLISPIGGHQSLPLIVTSKNTEAIGQLLYTKYSLPLEIASLLLLSAILGVVVLAKKEGSK
jgi:NADH-quinone oxidoreductase subunit J